jgi:molybdopterin synthase catalytic subunit
MGNRFEISAEPLEVAVITGMVTTPQCGAVATFVGIVRDHNAGRKVLWIDYEAYAPLARTTFEKIGREAAERWPSAQVAIGEASVVVVAASPHRADAFAACRYAIERVKQIAPVWKHEHFEGGEVWIEGAVANPDDEAARQVAFERACS